MDFDAGVVPPSKTVHSKVGTGGVEPPLSSVATATTIATGAVSSLGGATGIKPMVVENAAATLPTTAAAAGSGSGSGSAGSVAAPAPGPGRFFAGRKFAGRGRGRPSSNTTAAGRGAARGRGGSVAVAGGAGRGGGAASRLGGGGSSGGGILKVTAPVEIGSVALPSDGVAGAGAGDKAVEVEGGVEVPALSSPSASSAAAITGVAGAQAVSEAPVASPSAAAGGAVGGDGGDGTAVVAAESGLGSGLVSPPPIVSLDEMARADAAEKKRKRKARPGGVGGKKVGWADRAGRILQVVKEFHSEDPAQAVSATPQETPAEALASMSHHHHGNHKHWAERVKREREMERNFHGKGGAEGGGGGGGDQRSSSKGKGRSGSGSSSGARDGSKSNDKDNEAAALLASRKKAMVPTVAWRRPGPYQDGVVHEDVMLLEVESSEAESQGARTRAGLEQARHKLRHVFHIHTPYILLFIFEVEIRQGRGGGGGGPY